jgi:hypothetical protein
MIIVPRSIKKWCIRGQTRGEDQYYPTKESAILRVKSLLISGEKRVVHIGKFNEKLYSSGMPTRGAYADVESWELVNGVPKKRDNKQR